jgi:hypothetical protein
MHIRFAVTHITIQYTFRDHCWLHCLHDTCPNATLSTTKFTLRSKRRSLTREACRGLREPSSSTKYHGICVVDSKRSLSPLRLEGAVHRQWHCPVSVRCRHSQMSANSLFHFWTQCAAKRGNLKQFKIALHHLIPFIVCSDTNCNQSFSHSSKIP